MGSSPRPEQLVEIGELALKAVDLVEVADQREMGLKFLQEVVVVVVVVFASARHGRSVFVEVMSVNLPEEVTVVTLLLRLLLVFASARHGHSVFVEVMSTNLVEVVTVVTLLLRLRLLLPLLVSSSDDDTAVPR